VLDEFGAVVSTCADQALALLQRGRTHNGQVFVITQCDDKFVPFVKMIKGINRNFDEPINPPFLFEVMEHGLVSTPFGRYQDEITWFLASAAERVFEDWPDPAKIGPTVNGQCPTPSDVARPRP
jgi:hypothetical protein